MVMLPYYSSLFFQKFSPQNLDSSKLEKNPAAIDNHSPVIYETLKKQRCLHTC